jgi:hypothetical protein
MYCYIWSHAGHFFRPPASSPCCATSPKLTHCIDRVSCRWALQRDLPHLPYPQRGVATPCFDACQDHAHFLELLRACSNSSGLHSFGGRHELLRACSNSSGLHSFGGRHGDESAQSAASAAHHTDVMGRPLPRPYVIIYWAT